MSSGPIELPVSRPRPQDPDKLEGILPPPVVPPEPADPDHVYDAKRLEASDLHRIVREMMVCRPDLPEPRLEEPCPEPDIPVRVDSHDGNAGQPIWTWSESVLGHIANALFRPTLPCCTISVERRRRQWRMYGHSSSNSACDDGGGSAPCIQNDPKAHVWSSSIFHANSISLDSMTDSKQHNGHHAERVPSERAGAAFFA
mmetsp:Transcript_60704/g.130378  ORF Transcript_60704/g.130378 Transcript_60704/m.130378 type:complete len:200 (+) Transcript_60704:66-665(+)